MENKYILMEIGDDHICEITLNRPENLNTFNTPMARELDHALRAVDNDENVRVIVLKGAGKAFCAETNNPPPAPTARINPANAARY